MPRIRGNIDLTVEEILATISRSSFPTVVTEGKGDVIFYRTLEDLFLNVGLTVLGVGGRDKLLQVFDRLADAHPVAPVVFIADQDHWIYGEIPPRYNHSHLLLTDGYSVENDMFSDGELDGVMTVSERKAFLKELEDYCGFCSVQVMRYLSGADHVFDVHPTAIFESQGTRETYCALRSGEQEPVELFERVFINYRRMVRGKSLMALLLRQLSKQGRPIKHNLLGLMEVAISRKGRNLQRIIDQVGALVTPNQ